MAHLEFLPAMQEDKPLESVAERIRQRLVLEHREAADTLRQMVEPLLERGWTQEGHANVHTDMDDLRTSAHVALRNKDGRTRYVKVTV